MASPAEPAVTDPVADPAAPFVVRLLDPAGRTAGLGTLVYADGAAGAVLTCAHVVSLALGRPRDTQEAPAPGTVVRFDFPLLGGEPVEARVRGWRAPAADGAGEGAELRDLAGLVLAPGAGLPPGAAPARLSALPMELDRGVRLFGYPSVPPRPHGAWANAVLRGQDGSGHWQLDASADSGVLGQKGYSGTPVVDRGTGEVLGVFVQAADGRSGQRDSRAVHVSRVRGVWTELFGAARPRRRGRPAQQLTVLHLSDLQAGRPDRDLAVFDTALADDLDRLAAEGFPRPDLMVVSGDLSWEAFPRQFEQATAVLARLAEHLGIPTRHVALVPGDRDVNRRSCESYFLAQEAEGEEPVAPYAPKWAQFARAFNAFYGGESGRRFNLDQPWSLFTMPDLGVVVAGLNSTMALSHQDADRHGELGEEQQSWFARRLAEAETSGRLRLVAVHHAVEGAADAHNALRHRLDRALDPAHRNGTAHLLLPGLDPDGRGHRRYELVTVTADGWTRRVRRYSDQDGRWIGDTAVSPSGSSWQVRVQQPLRNVRAALRNPDERPAAGPAPRGSSARRKEPAAVEQHSLLEDLRLRVETTDPDARILVEPDRGYLRVCSRWADDIAPFELIGAAPGGPTVERIEEFAAVVAQGGGAAILAKRPLLVYRGPAAVPPESAELARRHGIRLLSFLEYQGLLDLSETARAQTDRWERTSDYRPGLYIPQRHHVVDRFGSRRGDDLLRQMHRWLERDDVRFVMVLGEFGHGKTFLLSRLARQLAEQEPMFRVPMLVELRGLEKDYGLDELLTVHMMRIGDPRDSKKLSYMLAHGRIVLLLDGFDEWATRVSYQTATQHLDKLLASAGSGAKVVLTSRSQHFLNRGQVLDALGRQVEVMAGSRIAEVLPFDGDQIRSFLEGFYGSAEQAADRLELLRDVDLLGLSENPRMLSLIAALPAERLLGIRERSGDRISASDLVRELIDDWLQLEEAKQHQLMGQSGFSAAQRERACRALALRMWQGNGSAIALADLERHVVEVLGGIGVLRARHYDEAEAAQAIGSRSLLVSREDGHFEFLHRSVLEWLVADEIAKRLADGATGGELLGAGRLSRLMTDFLCDLAPDGQLLDWADRALRADDETERQNALTVRTRLTQLGRLTEAPSTRPRVVLAELDLREREADLLDLDLRGADLRGATLRGMRLTGLDLRNADLRRADFTGARLIDCDLRGSRLEESKWQHAAVIGGHW